MRRKTLPCTEERANREHELLGENPIGRHVWRCTECGARTVGPQLTDADRADRDDRANTRRVTAIADGGERDA